MWQNHCQRHTFFCLICSISKHQPLGTKNINIRFTICNKFHGILLKSRHIFCLKLNIFSDCTSIFHNIQLAKWDYHLDCANCIMKFFNSTMCLLSCSIFSRQLSTQIPFYSLFHVSKIFILDPNILLETKTFLKAVKNCMLFQKIANFGGTSNLLGVSISAIL